MMWLLILISVSMSPPFRLPPVRRVELIVSSIGKDGCPYHKIQDAIDSASDGDMISVESGIYPESLNLSKRLTLRGLNTGRGKPQLVNNSSIIVVSANRSIVDVFNISGSREAGIWLLSWGNTILGNDFSRNLLGIEVQFGENM